jgi:predicted site-specific integrase-resolvase
MALTTYQVMAELRISRATFMRWLKAGKFRGARKHVVGGKTGIWLIPDETIRNLKKENPQ